MSLTPRWALVGLLLVLVGPILAQNLPLQDKPAIHSPKTPLAKEDLDRREAMRFYAVGVVNERQNRLVEAVRAYEAAGRLDPETSAVPAPWPPSISPWIAPKTP